MKRGAPMERKPMKRSRTTNGAFDADTKALATARAGGLCEVCHFAPVEQHHHRRPRGLGGSRSAATASVSNTLCVCSADHHIIEMNRDWSYALGYLVRQQWDPADVAVKIGGRFVFLTASGEYGEVPDVA